jgi:hypothetical protein
VKSIRWKLILTSVAVVFLPLYLLNRHSVRFFDLFTRTALEEQMADWAFIAGEECKAIVLGAADGAQDGAERKFARLLQSYGPRVEAEICVLNESGLVLFESGDSGLVGEDLSDRPEIAQALAGEYGARWALTPDRKLVYYFVALPIFDDDTGDILGAAYVFRHTSPIIQAIVTLEANQKLATTSALAVAVLIAAVLAQTLTRRLRKLTKASAAFAAGAGSASWADR